MQREILAAIRISIGVIVILIGIVGLFLPFIQGLVLIVLGLVIIFGRKIVMAMLQSWKKKGEAFLGLRKTEPVDRSP